MEVSPPSHRLPAEMRVLLAGARFALWWTAIDLCRFLGAKPHSLYGRFYDSVTALVDAALPRAAFLNYGYASATGRADPDREPGPSADPSARTSAALYRHTATAAGRVSLIGRDVLEVGAGLGGGARWVAENLGPRRVVAVDLSSEAVRRSRVVHADCATVSFEQGDAQRLEPPDASFDAVLSVETSHTYPDFAAFVAGVERVLRPGGLLLLADFRPSGQVERFRAALGARPGMKLVEVEDVTANVVEALRQTGPAKQQAIERLRVPAFVKRQIGYFAGSSGSAKLARFERREDVYLRVVVEKMA